MTTTLLLGLHYHHRGLITLGRGYDERKMQILSIKPPSEQADRIRHMWAVSDEAAAEIPEVVREAWAEGNRLWAEGDRLRAESDRLWTEGTQLQDEGDRLYGEGDRFWAEGTRLRAEGTRFWDKGDLLWTEGDQKAWHARWCPALHSPEGCRWNGQRLGGIGE